MAFVAEVHLSEVLGKDVVNQFGKKVGLLWDFVIIPGHKYPAVTRLLLKRRNQLFEVPVEYLNLLNRFVITVTLAEQGLTPYRERDEDILVKRHILDKQILDVNGAKVVRVNDLKLGDADGAVCVLAIDVGPNGVLRRIDGGRFVQKALAALSRPIKDQTIAWGFLQTIDPHLKNLTLNVARKQLGELHPSDLAQIVTEIPTEEGTALLSSVDEELAGEALHEMPSEVRDKILKEMDREVLSDILEEMPPDEAADILGDMSEETSNEILSLMEKEDAMEVAGLLSYDEDTAGGLMTSEFLDFAPDTSVDEVLANMRLMAPDVEFVYYLYVTDKEEHLLGVLTLKKLLTSPLRVKLEEIMTRNVKFVRPDTDRKEIAEMISKYDLIAIPVIGDDEILRGIIMIDDIFDLLVPNPTRKRRKGTFQ
jgi:magnesium transporter